MMETQTTAATVLDKALDLMIDDLLEVWAITTREPVTDPDGEWEHPERFE